MVDHCVILGMALQKSLPSYNPQSALRPLPGRDGPMAWNYLESSRCVVFHRVALGAEFGGYFQTAIVSL